MLQSHLLVKQDYLLEVNQLQVVRQKHLQNITDKLDVAKFF